MGAVIADTLDDLSPEWFTAALREGGTIAGDAAVVSAESNAIGTGQLGSVILCQLGYEGTADAPSSLVIKLPSGDETARQMGVALGVYDAEVRFYEELAPLVEIRVPHVHWSGLEPESGRFTLILEDLTPTAEVGDAVAGGTLEQIELAMKALAGLQAPLWDSPELRERPWLCDIARTEMLFAGAPAALEPFAERFGKLLEPAHLALARELAPKAGALTKTIWKPPFVVSHGDYRVDNMMFGAGRSATPVTVIDWQGARLGIPSLDPTYCLVASMSAEDRRAHEQDLLRAYHDSLLAAGVSGFSFDACWEGYRAASLYPFLALIPASLTLAQTERGDQLLTAMIRNAAELIADTGAARVLD
jgi:Phosphotransferase enzyme family